MALAKCAVVIFVLVIFVGLGHGAYAAWCAEYGYRICERTGNYFNRDCIYYTFDVANFYMGRCYAIVIVGIVGFVASGSIVSALGYRE